MQCPTVCFQCLDNLKVAWARKSTPVYSKVNCTRTLNAVQVDYCCSGTLNDFGQIRKCYTFNSLDTVIGKYNNWYNIECTTSLIQNDGLLVTPVEGACDIQRTQW